MSVAFHHSAQMDWIVALVWDVSVIFQSGKRLFARFLKKTKDKQIFDCIRLPWRRFVRLHGAGRRFECGDACRFERIAPLFRRQSFQSGGAHFESNQRDFGVEISAMAPSGSANQLLVYVRSYRSGRTLPLTTLG